MEWLPAGPSPWLLWGNLQVQSVLPLGGGAVPLVATSSQMCKVAYGRPETWNWFFSAKLLSGPDTGGVGQHGSLTVHWDLILGVGRSAVVVPDFDLFAFHWDDGAPFPTNQQIWSTQTTSPPKVFNNPGPSTGPAIVDTIAAQDIQLTARCFAQELAIVVQLPIVVELQAHFAPRSHTRPDWFIDGPRNEVFAGSETGGH